VEAAYDEVLASIRYLHLLPGECGAPTLALRIQLHVRLVKARMRQLVDFACMQTSWRS